MSLNPLGILKENFKENAVTYNFTRGIEVFPTVGDPVLLPTQAQLKAIVESGEKRRVKIGISPLAGNAVVSIDPDRLFGRHLAILGNTGSGKSCSVAGVVRWSIEAAKAKNKQNEQAENAQANTRFIILDPNGEYLTVFSDLENVHLFAVEENPEKNIKQLQIPIWFWNSAEWCAFTRASAKTQRPTLIQALRSVRDRQLEPGHTLSHDMRRFLRSMVSIILVERNQGNLLGNFPKNKSFFEKLQKWQGELNQDISFSDVENFALVALKNKIDQLVQARSVQYANMDFTRTEVKELLELAGVAPYAFGGSDQDVLPIDADIPRPFTGDQFLKSIEANAEIMNTSEYVETMLMRIRTLLSDTRLKKITSANSDLTLEEWLNEYICASNSSEGFVTVIDLSLIPAEVIHIITAIIARMTLEALQRYRKLNSGKTLPTALVMEEAHTFIKRYNDDNDESTAASMCAQVFRYLC